MAWLPEIKLGEGIRVSLSERLPCYWIVPVTAIESGIMPAGKGEPAMALRAPVVASVAKPESVLEPPLAT